MRDQLTLQDDQLTIQSISASPVMALKPRADAAVSAVRVLPGRPEEARAARRWVSVLAAAAGVLDANVAELAAGELFANAVMHTRSGGVGGKVTLVVAGDGGKVAVHVHDLGADGGQIPRLDLAAVPSGDDPGMRVSGRGLPIVAAVSVGWGTCPAARCPLAAADDPAVGAGGRCTWCRLPTVEGRHEGSGS